LTSKETFFIICPPGLEKICYLEACQHLNDNLSYEADYPQPLYVRGGFELELPFNMGLKLNYWMRTSTRILWRQSHWSCSHIRDFKNWARSFSWSDHFDKNTIIDLKFSSQKSRLSVKKQLIRELNPLLRPFKISVGEVSTDNESSGNTSLKNATSGKASSGHRDSKERDSLQTLYVRIQEDHCQISLDTTGERSQFRGHGKTVGKAPLRDNISAALVRILFMGTSKNQIQLIDPMMGSGSFLLEAQEQGQPLKRKFAFEEWGRSQRENKVEYEIEPKSEEKKQGEKERKIERKAGGAREVEKENSDSDHGSSNLKSHGLKMLGVESDKKTFATAIKNFELYGWRSQSVQESSAGESSPHTMGSDVLNKDKGQVSLNHGSATDISLKSVVSSGEWEGSFLIVNPPWGKRLKTSFNPEKLAKICSIYQPRRLGLLWGGKKMTVKVDDYRLIEQWVFENSGLS